jgi:hypothetical protein
MTNAVSPQALSQLIGSIYDCALDPSRWEQTLLGMRPVFDVQVAMLGLVDRRSNQILLERTVGMEPFWLEEVKKHVSEMNRCLGSFGSRLSPDEPFVISRHIPPPTP